MAICHCGAGSEGGTGACYVKFGAVRPGAGAVDRFERLLDTGRLGAYRRMLECGFRTNLIGISMRLRPDGPDYDGPEQYVIDDLR